eukprot:TRINITY_DN813_c5_g1_i1.p1 TRINITY_DN813_c5_g1~~TRINITY_DN813_c5_g1_i1.p1  ORF type:complete len:395 (+),score=168.02 TRINITY_DN813_c5_g1_i1:253-1437(+)
MTTVSFSSSVNSILSSSCCSCSSSSFSSSSSSSSVESTTISSKSSCSSSYSSPIRIFSDYDGTIANVDTLDVIIDYCIGKPARVVLDEAIVSGKLSFRCSLQKMFDGVYLSFPSALALLDNHFASLATASSSSSSSLSSSSSSSSSLLTSANCKTNFSSSCSSSSSLSSTTYSSRSSSSLTRNERNGLTDGVIEFVRWCQNNHTPFIVLSSGLEEVIRHFLSRVGLADNIEIRSNNICVTPYTEKIASTTATAETESKKRQQDCETEKKKEEKFTWTVQYRDSSPFGHDKAASLKNAFEELTFSYPSSSSILIFVGDGISDIPAAEWIHQTRKQNASSASRVQLVLFTRRGLRLEQHCINKRISFVSFSSFTDIQAALLQQYPQFFSTSKACPL